MKKIAFALLCVFATGSAAAQTYACQSIMTSGMAKKSAGWKATEFDVAEPFFLTISNSLIDAKSLAEQPSLLMDITTKCFRGDRNSPLVGLTHWCADSSAYLSFSEKNLTGALAYTYGAMTPSNNATADSVAVTRFKCQKVR